jgi:aldehyde:ferredoxin oxidoreductase
VVVHLDQMLPVYYATRGWDEEGVPTREKLAELGLGSV